MYTPTRFQITDPQIIRNFIQQNSFGILLSIVDGEIHDTHVPLVLNAEGTELMGHIAKLNEQWKGWEHDPNVKVIFHGPHTYISPRYYHQEGYVPTWNYTAVSVSGKVEIIQSRDDQLALIRDLVASYESGFPEPWQIDEGNQKMVNMLGGVVCFRITIETIEAKFKLNQDKTEEDRQSVIRHLQESGDPMSHAIAAMMENRG